MTGFTPPPSRLSLNDRKTRISVGTLIYLKLRPMVFQEKGAGGVKNEESIEELGRHSKEIGRRERETITETVKERLRE
jgi:hypothetical protein